MRRSAFTLIELLVVISIIALLIAILLPALGQARDTARMSACASLMRQYGIAAVNYATDNRSALPTAAEWSMKAITGNEYSDSSPYLELRWPRLLSDQGYLTIRAASDMVCAEYFDQTVGEWGYASNDPMFGVRVAQCYSMVSVFCGPDGMRTGGGPYQTPWAMYNMDQVIRPSERLMMSERHAEEQTQLAGTALNTNGVMSHFAWDNNPNGDKLPVGTPGTQWFGFHPHMDRAGNWLFYDASVRARPYPEVRANRLHWDFLAK